MGNSDDQSGRSQRYKPGNLREDGSYVVGKGRTPVTTRFAVGDDRERGRRAKGTKNLKIDLAEEFASKVPMKENGKRIRVTKQRAMVKVLLDNATKGQNRAIEIALNQHSRHFGGDDPSRNAGALPQTDQEIIDAYIMRRAQELGQGEDALDDRPSGAGDAIEPGESDGGPEASGGNV